MYELDLFDQSQPEPGGEGGGQTTVMTHIHNCQLGGPAEHSPGAKLRPKRPPCYIDESPCNQPPPRNGHHCMQRTKEIIEGSVPM
jgi:hypothetical protein